MILAGRCVAEPFSQRTICTFHILHKYEVIAVAPLGEERGFWMERARAGNQMPRKKGRR